MSDYSENVQLFRQLNKREWGFVYQIKPRTHAIQKAITKNFEDTKTLECFAKTNIYSTMFFINRYVVQ